MSEPVSGPQPPPAPARLAVLTITLDQATGEVTLNGPLHNRLLTYGMLAAAFETTLQRGLLEGGGLEGGRVLLPGKLRGM